MKIVEFKVDVESRDELLRLKNKLISYIKHIDTQSGTAPLSKAKRRVEIFESCFDIMGTDISHLYSNTNSSDDKYFVYAHCYPDRNICVRSDGVSAFAATVGFTHVPFYIGKGSGSRCFDLNRNETHRKIRQKINLTNETDPIVTILKDGLTEAEALIFESKLIDIFGTQAFGGKLVNLDEGKNSSVRKSLYIDSLVKINPIYEKFR